MRFFVECAFPHLGKRGVASRRSAFWAWALTEKCILELVPHGKAHSGCGPNLPVGIPPSAVTEDDLEQLAARTEHQGAFSEQHALSLSGECTGGAFRGEQQCGPKRPFDPQVPHRHQGAPRPGVPWVLPRTAFREGDLFAGWTIFFLQDGFSAGQTDVSHVPQHIPLLLRSPRADRPVHICSPACQSCLCSIAAILFALEYGACLAVERWEKQQHLSMGHCKVSWRRSVHLGICCVQLVYICRRSILV